MSKQHQVELRLVPTPGSKPEFLALTRLFSTNAATNNTTVPSYWNEIDKLIVLEGYTRDSWSFDTSTKWISFKVESVDGKNKLPGFINYLRQRQKSAFGRYSNGMIFVVPYKQMSSSTLQCRIAAISSIPKCPIRPKSSSVTTSARQPEQQPSASASTTSTEGTDPTNNNQNTSKKKKGFGLLGNLVGAQKRTNQQVETSVIKKKKVPPSSAIKPSNAGGGGSVGSGGGDTGTNNGPTAASSTSEQQQDVELKTAGQILAEFRQEMEQEMLDFDISPESVLKVKIDVSSKLRQMSEEEQQTGRVTVDILKYIVYEQAEEVNEEWVAYKEPSEFMDEVTVAIYKEGQAPDDVMEEMNKAELPDEIKGQQRAIQEQQSKVQAQRDQKATEEKIKAALAKRGIPYTTKKDAGNNGNNGNDTGTISALNTNKRDRRTIEEIQRGFQKRSKHE